MIDIPLYMFANLVVTNGVSYQKYDKGFFPLLKKSGGEFGICENQPLHPEGNSPRPGRIIPSYYQALSNCRRAGTRIEFTPMHRLLPRQ